ncbi:TPA: hypothetical protein U0F20_004781 [Escherichia coli]|nr:hypothetical protein [Escherichia coli]HEL8633764.1 hypothetical protein [Escherichia coli]
MASDVDCKGIGNDGVVGLSLILFVIFSFQKEKDQCFLLRSFFSARNLLLANKKTTATNGGLFAGSRATNSFSEGNWLQQSADTKYCPFSVAAVGPSLQELCKHLDNLALLIRLPVAAASGVKACLTGLDSRR